MLGVAIVVFCLDGWRLVRADQIVYLPTSFPEEQGWIRSNTLPEHLADRWLEHAWFVQHAEIVVPEPPHIGEQDFYRWETIPGETNLGSGSPGTFQMSWVLETDGPREGIVDVAPASITASGTSAIRFHFTIARDQVRLIDSYLNVFLWDIALGPHTYHMEVEDGIFKFWIDNYLVHQNTVPGPYPTSDSVVKFGARAAIEDSTTRWSYIAFGTIPSDGDFDDDGDVDLLDAGAYHECVSAAGPGGPIPDGCAMFDLDEDGDVDFSDFSEFQLHFTGGDNQ